MSNMAYEQYNNNINNINKNNNNNNIDRLNEPEQRNKERLFVCYS